jgi:hypothetical protein
VYFDVDIGFNYDNISMSCNVRLCGESFHPLAEIHIITTKQWLTRWLGQYMYASQKLVYMSKWYKDWLGCVAHQRGENSHILTVGCYCSPRYGVCTACVNDITNIHRESRTVAYTALKLIGAQLDIDVYGILCRYFDRVTSFHWSLDINAM